MNQNKKRGQQSQDQDQETSGPNQGNQAPRHTPERGRGSQSERNSSSGGISNRGMDREEEQEELPERGSGQSER
jgi:hypothetical protein